MKTRQQVLAGMIAGLLAVCSLTSNAQDRCGTMPVLQAAFNNDPSLQRRFEQQEIQLQQTIAARRNNPAARENAVLVVPVVFHIVLPNPAIVTDAQVQAQLDTLNKIYAGTNADTSRIPAWFKPL